MVQLEYRLKENLVVVPGSPKGIKDVDHSLRRDRLHPTRGGIRSPPDFPSYSIRLKRPEG